MTDEECARRVAAIHAAARLRVPEWEPWMTAKVGYGAEGKNKDARKTRKSERARARYLRRAANPEEYAAYLAKAREAQAVRDAAKRAGKT